MAMLNRLNSSWSYTQRLYDKYTRDGGPLFAAAIAYATLFSLFPLALLGISIAGFLIASPERQLEVVAFATGALPVELADTVRENIRGIVLGRGVSGALALIGLVIGAVGIFGSVETSLNRLLGSPSPRGPLRSVLLHLAMVLVIFGLAALSVVISYGTKLFLGFSSAGLSEGARAIVYQILATGSAVILSSLLFVLLLRLVPNMRIPLSHIVPVAVGAAVLWEAAKYLFGLYLESLARYSVVYGSLGAVVALLTWIYISASILLICASILSLKSPPANDPGTAPETARE